VQLLTEEKDKLLPQWRRAIRSFYAALTTKHLSFPLADCDYAEPSKLLISTCGTNLSGPQLADILRDQYRIEPEMSTMDTVLCMTGLGDSEADLLRLADALNAIDRTLTHSDTQASPFAPVPHAAMPIYEAAKQPTECVPLEQAAGRISGDFLWAYPPGIPLVVPGEVMNNALIAYISRAEAKGVDIHAAKNTPHCMLRVLKKT
jgi:arginine/lysine/ornithine decarboxylase